MKKRRRLLKTILVLLMFFCVITLPTFAESTIQDIEKIDAKIKESEARITENTNRYLSSRLSKLAGSE